MTKRQCYSIWILSVLGAISLLPYVYFLGLIPKKASLLSFFLKSFFFASIIYGIICWLSYLILKHVDLNPFPAVNIKNIILGIFSGLSVGFCIIFFNSIFFPYSTLASAVHPPFWTGILASFYGSINEEVICRLFLLTLIYFLLSVTFYFKKKYKVYFIGISIFLVSLLFGAGHLPTAFSLGAVSSFEIFKIFFLNGIAGITFGWLYCYKGFWSAVFAHFVADIIVHYPFF